MSSKTRVRRTPEEARKIILDVAAIRLSEHGLKGLNIKDIAEDAGINHGTVLHHFGSADQMRTSLLNQMTRQLVNEMSRILNDHSSTQSVFEALFHMMSQSGHIKLLAWRAMENVENPGEPQDPDAGQLLDEMTASVLDQMDARQVELARNLIFLAFSSAVGWGLCSNGFKDILGLSEEQQDKFPAWVGAQLPKLMVNDT